MAKVSGEGWTADEKKSIDKHNVVSVVRTVRSIGSDTGSGGGSETRLGSVMGTFAYMPPEQASGEVDRLDERADVFALGAILSEILTGKPPYVAKDNNVLHRMTTRGNLGRAMITVQATIRAWKESDLRSSSATASDNQGYDELQAATPPKEMLG